MKKFWLILLSALLILPGCQTFNTFNNSNNNLNLTGSIAAKNERQNWSGQFTLTRQDHNNYQIRLFGPVGMGSAIITKQNGIIIFNDGKQIIQNDNDKKLMQQLTGIAIPLDNVVKTLFSNKLTHIDDYKIEYLKTREINGKWFPEKIRISNNKILVKIAININYYTY